MPASTYQLCLLLDGLCGPVPKPAAADTAGCESPPPTPSGHHALPVPEDPCTLTWTPERGVHLQPGALPRLEPDPEGATRPDTTPAACMLEQVSFDTGPQLALLSPSPQRIIRVNGQPPPRVSLLSEGDQILFPGGVVLHVTVYRRPHVGPALPEHVGEKCLICRTPFTSASVLYACPCGRGMHHEEQPALGADDALQCAPTSSECPACQRPVFLEEGYSHVPETT